MPRDFKELKPAYGFDDVAISPGDITINPELADLSTNFDGIKLDIPFIASAMDAVVDPNFAIEMTRTGGLAVMNMDGIHSRYEDTAAIYEEIAAAPRQEATSIMQRIYSAPQHPELIAQKIEQVKKGGGTAAVSFVPQTAKRMAPVAVEAGADMVVVQGTVVTARHSSKSLKGLIFSDLVKDINVPVLVGNTVSYEVTKELMQQGIQGVMIGVGPGSVCSVHKSRSSGNWHSADQRHC